jgi:hypothetical protein
MDNHVGLADEGSDQFPIPHVAVPKTDSLVIEDVKVYRQIFNVSGIGKGIENDNLIIWIFVIEMPHKITPNETRTTRH